MTSFNSFRDLRIPAPMTQALERMDFHTPTPIQVAAIPVALDGRDILGSAQTGTGKTAAFAIPLLSRIYAEPGKTALVLSPTRELAAQINTVFRRISKGMHLRGSLVVGGESFGRQANEIYRGVDYIIATPGRLNDHLQEGTLELSQLSFLVLDEVDRMLDMGFAPQIRQVMKFVPQKRQTLLFSATLPEESVRMANSLLRDPIRITIKSEQKDPQIEIKTVKTSTQEKSKTILTELEGQNGKTLIFARTKSRTESLARALGRKGHKVVDMHGGRSQAQRKRALKMFRDGTHPILVATDIAGRGIDVSDIERVINYDLPQSHDDYIHRIGRTGRNGKTGIAVNFVTPEDSDVSLILTGKREQRQGQSAKPKSFRPFRKGPRRGPKRNAKPWRKHA